MSPYSVPLLEPLLNGRLLVADAREEIGLQEVMLRSQSSHVNEETEEENPVREMENF